MDARDRGLGRAAKRPWQVPPRGWGQVLGRVWREVSGDNVDLVAAGVAFYWLLGVFPAMVAGVSAWGLVSDPAEVHQLMETVAGTMPAPARAVIGDQLAAIASTGRTALGLGTVLGILTALWGAMKGTKALMQGLNIAYDQTEGRGFFSLNAQALLMLSALLVVGVVATLGVIVVPAALGSVGLEAVAGALRIGRWPLLGVGALAFLGVAYRYGPCRDEPQWRWASVGALAATVAWLAGSALFSFYVGRFGSYNETYGSLAGVVVLLLWFWLTAFVILVGAELDHELERQTTRGPPEPMGTRGAVAADPLPDEA